MTDHNREELIEKAAKAMAILDDYDGCFERLAGTDPEEPLSTDEEDAEFWRKRSRAALAVFEQAHTAQGTEEPEWAVSVARTAGYGDPVIYDFPDRLAAERFIKNPPLWFSREDNQTKTLVRRRKAGPWEAVPAAEGTGQPTNHEIRRQD